MSKEIVITIEPQQSLSILERRHGFDEAYYDLPVPDHNGAGLKKAA